MCYLDGTGVPEDAVSAVKWFNAAAEQGMDEAVYSLGECYTNGSGVEQDLDEALRLFTQAAESDYPEAQYRLATIYREGIGVAPDTAEAYVWFERAATNGHHQAQSIMGDYYFNGDNTLRDYEEAVKWYMMAQWIDEWSRFRLGQCYYYGWGVDQDLVKAWFYLAECGVIALENDNDELISLVQARLTESQRSAIDRAARIYWDPFNRYEVYQVNFPGAQDQPLSLNALVKLNQATGLDIMYEELFSYDPAMEITKPALLRIGLKDDGQVLINYDKPARLSSQELPKTVKLKLAEDPHTIVILAMESEERQEKAVTTLKMLNQLGCKHIYVKVAGPDPDYQAWLKSKEMNNQMIESIGDILTTVSEAPQPPEEQPFECVPYDDAPFPLTPIQPEYPAFALRAGVRGTVVLEAEIRKDGTMREVKVKRSIPFLDAAAIEAVRKVRWAPGKRAGQPVDTTVIIPIEFQ